MTVKPTVPTTSVSAIRGSDKAEPPRYGFHWVLI